MSKKLTTEEFIGRANIIHDFKYNYDKVIYINSASKITICCPVHGDFLQQPTGHLRGHGCTNCAGDAVRKIMGKSRSMFISEISKIHHYFYDYKDVIYINGNIKIDIICPIHGKFSQKPRVHLEGHGCSKCANYGIDYTKPAILYYIYHFKSETYKLGITNRSIPERFGSSLSEFRIIKIQNFTSGYLAHEEEQRIFKIYPEFRVTIFYKGWENYGGFTEFFIKDVLNLDIRLELLEESKALMNGTNKTLLEETALTAQLSETLPKQIC